MTKRHRIQFPPDKEHQLSQAEAYFYIVEEGRLVKLRFHEYDKIFARPGLYEQLFYERLKCTSRKRSRSCCNGVWLPSPQPSVSFASLIWVPATE